MASFQSINFIDIHTHILPGIDDGARDLSESLLILEEAVEIGIREIILTPHFSPYGVDLKTRLPQFESFKETVSQRGMDITLHLGSELMVSPDLPQLIKNDKSLTINGKGKYVLIEVPSFEIPIYASAVLFRLLAQGITPIWAHPERCFEIFKDHRIASNFVNNGGMLQINAGSLLGKYGRKVRSSAISLIKAGLCHVVASDIHRKGELKTLLPDAFLYLENTIGNAKAVDMVFSIPSKLVNGVVGS
jgi:protein-tyrosine phosphatase